MKLKFIVIFLILSSLIVFIFNSDKEIKIQSHLKNETNKFVSIYNSFYSEYKKLSEVIYLLLINDDKILELYINANSKDKQIQADARDKLYSHLNTKYNKLKNFNIRQLHFHLKNNDSFLRMHKPKKFGDNLTSIRSTVAYVNKHKNSIDSFEEGRVYNGYRFVFPLSNKENIHLGSVEISFSAKAFTVELMKHYDVWSNFLVSKAVVDKKVFKSEKSNYVKSLFNDFYRDKDTMQEIKKLNINVIKPTKNIIDIANSKIKDGKPFSIYSKNRKHTVVFIPIKNILTKKVVACLTISAKDNYIVNKRVDTNIIIIGSILFTAFALFFIYTQIQSKVQITKAKDYLNSILDSQSNFIVITDGKELVSLNKYALNFFGFSSIEEFYKKYKCICDLFIEDENYITKEKDGILWIDFILENPDKDNQVKIKSSLGNIHIFQIKSSPLKSSKNHFVVTFNDVTVLQENTKRLLETNKQLEKSEYELQLLSNNLNSRVKRIVKELETQHQKHKEDVIKNTKFLTIGQMAAGITHEINTPLTYVKGAVEMSREDLNNMPNNEFKQNLIKDNQKIMDGINRMSIIVESMREMSQVTPTIREEFNIYATLITVLRMLYNRSKQISKIYINDELFDLESSDKERYKFIALVHKQRIEQVWTIILNNALDELIKIDNYDKRRIDISIYSEDGKINIDIKDNAGGIPKDILPNIFEPFVSTKESSGIGIGLNVAKKICDEHNATIEAFNNDSGACFRIII